MIGAQTYEEQKQGGVEQQLGNQFGNTPVVASHFVSGSGEEDD